MVRLVLQAHAVLDDIGGDDETDAWDEQIQRGLTRSDGHFPISGEINEPADQQFRARDGEGGQELEESEIKEAGGVLFRKDLTVLHVLEHAAQEAEGQNCGNHMDGEHQRKPDLNRGIDLVILVCPDMNIVAHMDGHSAGMAVMICFGADSPFKGP